MLFDSQLLVFCISEEVTYDRQILEILSIVGEQGISVNSIALHVCNQNRTLFFQPDLQEVKAYVQRYLYNNSKSPYSLIERSDKRGYYRLNTDNSEDARQLKLQFQEEMMPKENDEETVVSKDQSLFLFE